MKLDPLDEVLAEFRAGRCVVIVDDADRENEGDLTYAAEMITPEGINFMIQEGRGLICVSLTTERTQELGIPMQVLQNTATFGTNFTVSVDHISCAASGVSAESRAKTILRLASSDARPEEFVLPGFVFPVQAVPGGVLRRRGQTEGSVDLARLAGLTPAGVICEIMSPDGVMLAGAELEEYAHRHGLKMTSVEEIAQYRLRTEVALRRVAECQLDDLGVLSLPSAFMPLGAGLSAAGFRAIVYVDDVDEEEHLAIVLGSPVSGALVRVHSECLTGDVFDSRRCDCGYQLQAALNKIIEAGSGVVVYLHQEGRGIGLGNKLRAYELQERGLDTVDANLELGFAADSRNYRAGAHILSDLGLAEVRLMTNNPEKVLALTRFGIEVVEKIPIHAPVDEFNARYLSTKREKFGHSL